MIAQDAAFEIGGNVYSTICSHMADMTKSPLPAETLASADCDEMFAKDSSGYPKRREKQGRRALGKPVPEFS
jgi:hypothetical protein